MAEKIQNITDKFNATVKKGSLFQIDYYADWEQSESLEVTSGKATAIRHFQPKPWEDGMSNQIFRADQADKNGNIEIVATHYHRSSPQPSRTYKIKVV